jgi:hypothetical protein
MPCFVYGKSVTAADMASMQQPRANAAMADQTQPELQCLYQLQGAVPSTGPTSFP